MAEEEEEEFTIYLTDVEASTSGATTNGTGQGVFYFYKVGCVQLIRISESRRDQEEGGELDSHEEVRLSFASPGEIKRREVVLDPQESPEEVKSREGWSWA